MRANLDLHILRQQLRQAEEREPQFDEELNPYLLHTVLPRLEQEDDVKLDEIDLSAFDAEDPYTFLEYIDWKEELREDARRMADRLCSQEPVSAKERIFL